MAKKYKWIDEKMDIDFTIPEELKEKISEIERLDLDDKQYEYVMACSVFNQLAKKLIGSLLTESQYWKLSYKYR